MHIRQGKESDIPGDRPHPRGCMADYISWSVPGVIRSIYERLGGTRERIEAIELGGQSFEQISFVWNDTSSLRTI